MIISRRLFLPLAVVFCGLAFLPDAGAQVRVEMSLQRGFFIRFEPVIATISITNLTGNPLELSDQENHKWFSFNIESVGQDEAPRLVPPYNPDYTLNPISIQAGETIKRAVNITPLYPISEYGIYRIRPTVYDARTRKYYSSAPINIEITEGRVIWQQEIGVPGQDGTRTASLLLHRLADQSQLYLRIEDKKNGLVFCTHQLGRVVSFGKPDVMIGPANDINILQNYAPKMFLYTRSDIEGKILERKQFASSELNRPQLARAPGGEVQVAGGIYFDPAAMKEKEQQQGPPPSVSERPVPIPRPE